MSDVKYLRDNSTPDKVVRRLVIKNKKDKFKYEKLLDARLLVKDDKGHIKERGSKWDEVTKSEFVESAIRGLKFSDRIFEEMGQEFDLEANVKKLAKKLGLTQKEVKEKLKALDDFIEAEFKEVE